MKKLWIPLLSLILLSGLIAAGIGIRSYYLFLKQPMAPLTHAVPGKAVVFMKSGSIAGFIEKTRSSGLIDILDNSETNAGFHKFSTWADSVSHQDDLLRKLIEEKEFLISFVPDSLERPTFLLVVRVGKIRANTLNKHIRDVLEKSGYTAASVKHQPSGLFHIKGTSVESWYYYHRGLFALSPDRSLLEQSLSAIDGASPLTDDPSIAKLSETAGKRVDAVLFLRNDLLLSQLTGIKENPLNAKDSPFNGWTALDLSFRKDKLQLSGFTWNGKEASNLTGQAPSGPVSFASFPSSAALGFTLLLSDPAAYTKQFTPGDTLHVTGFDTINSIPVKEVFRLKDHLWSWMGSGIGYVTRTPNLRSNRNPAMLLISSRNRDSAEMALRPFLQKSGQKTARLMAARLPARLWGPWFDLKDPLYCYIGQDVVALSHSRDFLNSYASEKESEVITGDRTRFAEMHHELSDKSSLILYLKPDLLAKSAKEQGKKDKKNAAVMWAEYFSGCEQLVMNFNAGSSMLYAQGSIKFKENLTRPKRLDILSDSARMIKGLPGTEIAKAESQAKEEPPSDMQKRSRNASAFSATPVIISGKKPGEKLIAMFTKNNALEVFDAEGDFLWSFQCRGNVTGNIFEADFRKNGQRHYLVVTDSYLHILDQHGKEVRESPVSLPGKAGSSAALFDYDRKRDYRLIYAGKDKLIHNITLKGEPLPDWHKPRLDNLADKPSFFRTGGRDYLVFGTPDGRLLITDRRGRERIGIPASFRKSHAAALSENKTNSKGLFLTASEDGRLVYITEKGIISYSSFGNFGKHPWFYYTDFDDDGSFDFLFAGNGRISIFSRMKNIIATKEFRGRISGKPFLYTTVSGERWLAARDEKSNSILVLRSKGSGSDYDKLKSETDPVIFNPGGSRKEVLITTWKGKLILTPIK